MLNMLETNQNWISSSTAWRKHVRSPLALLCIPSQAPPTPPAGKRETQEEPFRRVMYSVDLLDIRPTTLHI